MSSLEFVHFERHILWLRRSETFGTDWKSNAAPVHRLTVLPSFQQVAELPVAALELHADEMLEQMDVPCM
jgi:hypothetical protein